MRAAIMQPTYLPWAGYFDLMDQVDIFVFLDNVQFDKRSWQQRNRIKSSSGLQMLTVPVKSTGRLEQRIRDVELADPSFAAKHLASVSHCYAKAPYFKTYNDQFAATMRTYAETGRLADLTVGLANWLAEALAITTRRATASSLCSLGRRSALLASICSEIGATTYLSPEGACGYLVEERASFDDKGIEILVQQYEPQSYVQLHGTFEPFASVLDILMNCGPRSLDVVRSGRRPCQTLGAWHAANTPATAL